ncbi:MAG TPA: RDD family protein [Rubricoccaceae bacterium]|nr:RDD family protein [Rubricoccaceae bacterium]
METHDPNAPRPVPPAPPPAGAPLGTAAGTTSYVKADPAKRFVAALIDFVIAWVVALILSMGGSLFYGIGQFVAGAYLLVRDGLEYDFMDRRSVGKKIMKLRPVHLDGGVMDVNTSARRNWPLALGYFLGGLVALAMGAGMWTATGSLAMLAWLGWLLVLVEGILVLTDKEGRRIGDKQANTQVIESEA